MKLRPMTWGWWVEVLFGIVFPSVFVLPGIVNREM